MKMKYIALALLAFGLTTAASAEDRVTAGYSFPAVSYQEGVWSADVEKNLVKLGNVDVFAGAGFNRAQQTDFADTVWTATLGAQVPLSDRVALKTSVTRNFVSDVQDVDSFSLGVVYQGDLWRFAGAAVKTEYVNTVAELTAERKVLGDLAVGVGSQFDGGEYYDTKVFVSYSF